MPNNELNTSNSSSSNDAQVTGSLGEDRPGAGWVRMSAIAAASALAGGLAAAWYYRKTLSRLQQAQDTPESPDFGISEDHTDPDT